MTGFRTRLTTTIGRAGVGTVAAAVTVFATLAFAPIASATPEGDADAAITQAWDADGGDTGPLGVKDGGVYPAGAGFGQNFAGGKIFFTPDTGAHAMQGAILDKYLALGGPADGDLGFPTIDEGDGRAPGSRNTTFSAADRPVIFWTLDTGARVVRGAINAAWDKLGGSAAVLGVPTEDEAYHGDEISQAFTGGQLSWNRKTNAFTTTPPELADQLVGLEIPGDVTSAISAARRMAGGPMGPLGAADGAQYPIGADGAGQNFSGGKIFYSPATGANVLTSQVLAKYESVGGPQGDLGFPTSSEKDAGLAPMSMIASFAAADQPVIFWSPDFGAVIVRGAMNAAWAKLGGATGELGAPTADQTQNGGVVTQKFSGGAISWNNKTHEFTTEPSKLASQLSGLDVPGQDLPQTPSTADTPGAKASSWFHPTWWWLLVLLPVLVLVGALATAVLLNRRRRDNREFESGPVALGEYDDYGDSDDDDHDDDDGYESQVDRRSGWAMPDDQHPDLVGGDRHDGPGVFATDLDDDQDAINTAPTRIATDVDQYAMFTHADDVDGDVDHYEPDHDEPDDDLDDEPASGPPSGRHAAIQLDEPTSAETSLRLATDDAFNPPTGYPIKADTTSGQYWLPGSADYDRTRAEIWFASEEFAMTNGFVKAREP